MNEEKNKKQNENAAGSDTELQGHFILHVVPEQKETAFPVQCSQWDAL